MMVNGMPAFPIVALPRCAIVWIQTDCLASIRQAELDYECSGKAFQVRLVRQITPNSQMRVVATNLDAQAFPYAVSADLYTSAGASRRP